MDPSVGADSQPARALGRLIDIQTRFLYPFWFQLDSVAEAERALVAARLLGHDHLWTRWLRPDLKGHSRLFARYEDEVLDHSLEFLFPSRRADGCGYLTLQGPAIQAWFQDASLRWADGRELPVGMIDDLRVELFLSEHGAGVLSLGLTPGIAPLALEQAQEFNYRLAQLGRGVARPIHKAHPGDDPERLARLSEADRARLAPPPAADAPLAERLARRGGSFTIAELIQELLGPLRLASLDLEPIQPALSVYTVARFDDEVDFERSDVRDRLGRFLASLAQVEESGHPGAVTGELGIEHALLNRKHWAGVGQLGAAHLIADQPEDHPFNPERPLRVRDKYFIPYLMALMQRVALHRVIRAAGRVAPVPSEERDAQVGLLQRHMLEFAVRSHFTQVSTRHAVQRFYKVAHAGLDVSEAWNEARRSIADLDADLENRRRDEVAEGIAENLKVVVEVQRMVEVIEYVLVVYYAAALAHIILDPKNNAFDLKVITGAGGVALLGTILYQLGNRFRHRPKTGKRRDRLPV